MLVIADVFEQACAKCRQRIGIPEASGDYQAILSNPDVQAVVICSSTDTHSQFITEAAQAGKQIFCEKPIDFDLGRIDGALAAVEQAGVKLQIGFNPPFSIRIMCACGKQSKAAKSAHPTCCISSAVTLRHRQLSIFVSLAVYFGHDDSRFRHGTFCDRV